MDQEIIPYKNTFGNIERSKIVDLASKTLWSDEGFLILEYLRKTRGLSDEIIRKFNIGYCPPRIEHQLRGRIIFPVYDPYGELVAISTRHLNKDHPHRFFHESYEKSFYLYGLNEAKDNILKYNRAIVVEGEFDVSCLHSHELNMTVGASGSAFNIVQTSLLMRYCRVIYFVFDGDEGGRRANENVRNVYEKFSLSQLGVQFYTTILPEGTDPDDQVMKYGKNQFLKMLAKTKQNHERNLVLSKIA